MESRHETEQKLSLEEEELACQVRRFFRSKCSPALIYTISVIKSCAGPVLILVVFHMQLPSGLERIPLRIIWQFLLCSQFSSPVSAWSLSSPFPWFSLPQIARQEKTIIWGPLPLILELSVLLKSHCRPRVERRRSCGKPVISEGKFNHTTSTWSHQSVLQWPCLTMAAKFDNLNCYGAVVLSHHHRVLMEVSLTCSNAFCGSSSDRRNTLK